MNPLVQPDAGHHVAGAFRHHAEIGFLGGECGRHALSRQQLPDEVEPHDGDEHDQAENKHHAGDGGMTPWRQHLILRLGDQHDERIAVALLVETQAWQPIQAGFKIMRARKSAGTYRLVKGSVRHVASGAGVVVGTSCQDDTVGRKQ